MKFIRYLLAIYIIALSVYPCSDRYICQDELKKAEQVIQASEHSNEEMDECTPFCICSCCAAHMRLSSVSDIDFAGVIHNTKETIPYAEKQVLSDHNHIWQPPRI